MKEVLFSIISVSYNCKDYVDLTLSSLLNQSYNDYELIIIDGKSTDGTLDEINKYKNKFANIKIVSEEDSGIYDAMNKGVRYASGKYVFFLNFGDAFFDNNLLENVASKMRSNKDVYYGDIERQGTIIKQEGRFNLFNFVYQEGMVCHQSIFVRRTLLEKHPFDLKHKICADRDFFIKILKDNCSVEYIGLTICHYDDAGESSNLDALHKDSDAVSYKWGGLKARLFIFVMRKLGRV